MTIPTEGTRQMTTTVDVNDLRRALRATLPFADLAGYPGLCGVYLEAAHNNLVLTASDRYVAGHARILASGGALQNILISRRDVKLLRRALDKAIPGDGVAHLQRIPDLHGEDLLEIAVTDLTVRVRTIKTYPGTYSGLLKIFRSVDEKPAGLDTPIRVDPDRLRPFAKAQKALRAGEPRWTFHGPTNPIRVEIGRTFVGLIMPQKFSDQHDPTPVPVGLVAKARKPEYA